MTEFLSVLDAERTALAAEQQWAQSTTNVALDEVQLFKALGGGWERPIRSWPRRRSRRRNNAVWGMYLTVGAIGCAAVLCLVTSVVRLV